MISATSSGDVALSLLLISSRPPKRWAWKDCTTSSVSGPLKPTIIRAPTSGPVAGAASGAVVGGCAQARSAGRIRAIPLTLTLSPRGSGRGANQLLELFKLLAGAEREQVVVDREHQVGPGGNRVALAQNRQHGGAGDLRNSE